MRIVNVLVRAILELPFPTPLGRRLMLLFVTGRQTGKTYRLPVSYVPDGDSLLTPGGGNWKLNLANGQPIRIRLRGEDRYATPEIIRAAGDIEPLLEKKIDQSEPDGPAVRTDPGNTTALLPGTPRAGHQPRVRRRPLAPRPQAVTDELRGHDSAAHPECASPSMSSGSTGCAPDKTTACTFAVLARGAIFIRSPAVRASPFKTLPTPGGMLLTIAGVGTLTFPQIVLIRSLISASRKARTAPTPVDVTLTDDHIGYAQDGNSAQFAWQYVTEIRANASSWIITTRLGSRAIVLPKSAVPTESQPEVTDFLAQYRSLARAGTGTVTGS